MSLERAFQYAGSPALMSTFWTVDDAASANIVEGFLSNLKSGLPKDQALYLARLNYLETASPERMAPYYWSSFKLSGNTQALRLQSSFNFVWLIIPFGLLLIIWILSRLRSKKATY